MERIQSLIRIRVFVRLSFTCALSLEEWDIQMDSNGWQISFLKVLTEKDLNIFLCTNKHNRLMHQVYACRIHSNSLVLSKWMVIQMEEIGIGVEECGIGAMSLLAF